MPMMTKQSKLVTVFGGSGFLGRYVVRALAAKGYRVRVACRRPDLAGHLQPLAGVGQLQLVQANLRYKWSIDRAVAGADCVVNLVGILAKSGQQTFESLQERGAGWVSEAASNADASMVQISAIGADQESNADYARTKALGEKLVLEASPNAIILRPSVIFGPEDDFFNRFAAMAKFSPVLPLIGGGQSKFQLVYVGDVAKAVAKAVDGQLQPGSIWELGGPEVLTFKQCMERLLEHIERKRALVSIPFGIASSLSGILQYMPGAPLTPGQVEMLKFDNVVSENAKSEGRTLSDMGIEPTSLDAVLPRYMVQYRKHGQFQANRGL